MKKKIMCFKIESYQTWDRVVRTLDGLGLCISNDYHYPVYLFPSTILIKGSREFKGGSHTINIEFFDTCLDESTLRDAAKLLIDLGCEEMAE